MVVRGGPLPTPATQRQRACAQIAQDDADRLWAALVAIRGRDATEASVVGQAHLAAVAARDRETRMTDAFPPHNPNFPDVNPATGDERKTDPNPPEDKRA